MIKKIEKEVNIAIELINKHTDILFQKPKVKKNYFQDKLVGCKAGHGPYLRPEIHYYFKNLERGYIIFGLGLQFK